MKKFFALLATPALLLSACAGQSAQSPSETASVGTVRVGLEGVYPPYSFHDDSNTLAGFETDIARQLVEDMGEEPQYVETEWDSLIAGLDVDRYDMVINNIGVTKERQERYDLTIPYMYSTPQLVVPEDSDIKAISDLPGHTCASTPTSNFGKAIQENGGKILPASGFNDTVELVQQGRADCLANDAITLGYYMTQHPEAKLRMIPFEQDTAAASAIMVKKGNTELLNALNEGIRTGLKDGSIKAAVAKYVGEEAAAQVVDPAAKNADSASKSTSANE
ncbi:transporter substrate-binding domain-containing protein [Neoactinobaculum massilliense]|uniref:transporter substrate-binding domain-containing protein n=1 Tax=Neoactinobaculum massilliense TaxID=2364794 RepID=UPI000F52D6CD|nr:transporter substrate-binding domain-containing protein [Neoactinobaculum massilliense]